MKGTTIFTLYYKHVVKTMQAINPEYKPTKKELVKAIASDALVLVGAASVVAGVVIIINSNDEENTENL